MSQENKGSLKSVLYFAFVFFLLLIPYITGNNIEKLMSDSINKDYSAKWNGYEWDGFKSLSILYFTTAILCWLVPPIIAKLGPKLSLAVAGTGVSLSLATYLYPFKYGLIAAALMTGSFNSMLLIGQGSYLGLVSSKETSTRDTGLCFSIYQLAPIVGGSLVTLLFGGKENIPHQTRIILYSGLVGFGFIGVALTMFLKSSKPAAKSLTPVQVLKKSFHLLTTKRMACLAITCLYTGQMYSFICNLYPTSVGYTRAFGVNRKQYAGESGICFGLGEFSAGVLLFLTRNNRKAERLLFIGYILTLLTVSCIYINLPDNANRLDTDEFAIIRSNLPLALLSATFLGFVDGCYQTQLFRTIIKHYPEDTTAPFGIYFSAQAAIMAAMNLFSSLCGLHVHCILLMIGCSIGTIAFFVSLSTNDGRGDVDEIVDTRNSKTNSIRNNNESESTINVDKKAQSGHHSIDATGHGDIKFPTLDVVSNNV